MKLSHAYSSVVLVIMVFSAISWQTATIIHFYADQDAIAAQHCINKDKPELNCHGKCHLKKKLDSKIENVSPKTNRTIQSSLIVFQGFQKLNQLGIFDVPQKETLNPPYRFSIKKSGPSEILDPPQFT